MPPAVERARNQLLTNLLVLPGFGSLLAGRRVGWAQMPLALAGFILTLIWFVSFGNEWVRLGEFPPDGGRHFTLGLIGVGLFLGAWGWALATGLSLLRAARKRPGPNFHPAP